MVCATVGVAEAVGAGIGAGSRVTAGTIAPGGAAAETGTFQARAFVRSNVLYFGFPSGGGFARLREAFAFWVWTIR